MAITLEKDGQRVYILGDTYAVKDRLKSELGLSGKNFDFDRKAWWCGAAKLAQAEALIATLNTEAAAPAGEKTKEDPRTIRLIGKARYKGRTYYVRWAGETKDGSYKARLITLDQSLDFWAKCVRPHVTGVADGSGDTAVIVKTYPVREYRGREEHTTLYSIQRFVEKQRNPDTRRVQCPECDAYHDAGESCAECGGC